MPDTCSIRIPYRSSRVTAASALLVILLAGCTTVYDRLRPETEIPELRQRLEPAVGSDVQTVFVPVDPGDGRAVNIALHVSGPRTATRAILLVHGIMSDGAMWRYLSPALAGEYRVIAVDLPGCGQSDAPDPKKLARDAYSPPWLSRCILTALRAHLAETATVPRITLVGHSLGGMLILRTLSDPQLKSEFADLLDRVDNALLFTPIDVAIEKDQPLFKMLRELSDAEIALADATGILRAQVGKAIADSVVDPAMATREEADRMLATLRDPRLRHAMQAMIARAVPHTRTGPDWGTIEALSSRYAEIRRPCLIIWGGRDELFPESMGHRLVNLIPNARLRVAVPAKHCLPTEHPQVCIDLIRQFASGTGGGIDSARIAYYELRPQPRAAVVSVAQLPARHIEPVPPSVKYP